MLLRRINLISVVVGVFAALLVFTKSVYASVAKREGAHSAANTTTLCLDAWRGVKACIPRHVFSIVKTPYPQIQIDGRAADDQGRINFNGVVHKGTCSKSLRRRSRATLLQAIFGPEIPDLRLNFEYFEVDMDVDASNDGVNFRSIHFGFKNCW